MANQLALSFEWQDSNGWKKLYVQSREVSDFAPGPGIASLHEPGALWTYVTAQGLIRFLHQVKVYQPLAWYRNLGIARLKEIIHDHLSQTINVEDATPPDREVIKPTMINAQAIGNQLRALGAQRVNGARLGFGGGQGTCNECDGCMALKVSHPCAVIRSMIHANWYRSTTEKLAQVSIASRYLTHHRGAAWVASSLGGPVPRPTL